MGTLAGGVAAAGAAGAAGAGEPAVGADPGAAGVPDGFDAEGGVTGTCASAALAIATSQTKHNHALFLSIRQGYVPGSFTSSPLRFSAFQPEIQALMRQASGSSRAAGSGSRKPGAVAHSFAQSGSLAAVSTQLDS